MNITKTRHYEGKVFIVNYNLAIQVIEGMDIMNLISEHTVEISIALSIIFSDVGRYYCRFQLIYSLIGYFRVLDILDVIYF